MNGGKATFLRLSPPPLNIISFMGIGKNWHVAMDAIQSI